MAGRRERGAGFGFSKKKFGLPAHPTQLAAPHSQPRLLLWQVPDLGSEKFFLLLWQVPELGSQMFLSTFLHTPRILPLRPRTALVAEAGDVAADIFGFVFFWAPFC